MNLYRSIASEAGRNAYEVTSMTLVKLSSDGCRLMQGGISDKRLRDRIGPLDLISGTKNLVRLKREGSPFVSEVLGRV